MPETQTLTQTPTQPAAAPDPQLLPGKDCGNEAGLTLIEMIVVLAIIALIAALIVPNIIGRPDEARVTLAQTDQRTIAAALKMYRLDNGDYPTTEQGLAALAHRPTTGAIPTNWSANGYLEQLPTDPWGRPYIYHSPAPNGAGYEIISLGKDGKPGGDGLNQDLVLSGN
jgi:general secretion pathway protein G